MALRDRADSAHAALGDRFYHLGPPRDDDVTLGLSLTEVTEPPRGDVRLVHGGSRTMTTHWTCTRRSWEACLDAKLPLVCANPDLVVMIGDDMTVCAGSMAGLL